MRGTDMGGWEADGRDGPKARQAKVASRAGRNERGIIYKTTPKTVFPRHTCIPGYPSPGFPLSQE